MAIVGPLEPKWISHAKSIKIENNIAGRSWAWVTCAKLFIEKLFTAKEGSDGFSF